MKKQLIFNSDHSKLVVHMCHVKISIRFHYTSNIEMYSMVFIYMVLQKIYWKVLYKLLILKNATFNRLEWWRVEVFQGSVANFRVETPRGELTMLVG